MVQQKYNNFLSPKQLKQKNIYILYTKDLMICLAGIGNSGLLRKTKKNRTFVQCIVRRMRHVLIS